MRYDEWLDEHQKKKEQILAKLQGFDSKEIVEYFDYDNMVKKEKDFCLLYAMDKKCHDIKELNCFFCACPHFEFDDDGLANVEHKTLYSKCCINSKYGGIFEYNDAIHQDCTQCYIPHKKSYVKKNI